MWAIDINPFMKGCTVPPAAKLNYGKVSREIYARQTRCLAYKDKMIRRVFKDQQPLHHFNI